MVSFHNAVLETTFAGVCCSTPGGIVTSPYSIVFHEQVAPDVSIHFSNFNGNLTGITRRAQFISHQQFNSASEVSSGSLEEEEMTLMTSCWLQISFFTESLHCELRWGNFKDVRSLPETQHQMKNLLLLQNGNMLKSSSVMVRGGGGGQELLFHFPLSDLSCQTNQFHLLCRSIC